MTNPSDKYSSNDKQFTNPLYTYYCAYTYIVDAGSRMGCMSVDEFPRYTSYNISTDNICMHIYIYRKWETRRYVRNNKWIIFCVLQSNGKPIIVCTSVHVHNLYCFTIYTECTIDISYCSKIYVPTWIIWKLI